MEKVFSEPGLSKFDVRKLSDINKPASSTKLEEASSPANDCKYSHTIEYLQRILINSFNVQHTENIHHHINPQKIQKV